MLEKIKVFFKEKSIGFYVALSVVVLSIIQVIIYSVAFGNSLWEKYISWQSILFSIIAIVLGIGLSIFKVTSKYAPSGVVLFEFLAFLMFARFGYMYFSELFFGGISAKLIFGMYYGYLWNAIISLLIFGLGIASIFMKQNKEGVSA